MKAITLFGVFVLLLSLFVASPAPAQTATAAGSAAYSSYDSGGERWYGTGTGILGTAAGFGGYLHAGYDRPSGGPGIPGFDSQDSSYDTSAATGPAKKRSAAPPATAK